MESLSLIALLAGALAVSALARRVGVSPPLLLVAAGLALSFVPGMPDYRIHPEIVLLLVLPPLLYSAALDSSYLRFRDNLRPIGLLAVGLVLFTTLAVGAGAWWLVPGLPLDAALVLGAVLSPPDAVAATSIGRRLGLPRRLMTLLSGESLVNDATALTAFRVAVASAVGAGYTLPQGLGIFAVASLGGAGIGWAVGWTVHRARRLLPGNLASAAGLLVPFGTYLVAEEAQSSGVLAVVTAGLYLGHHAPEVGAASRLQDAAVWQAADTVLEAFVFALIGLQVRGIVVELDSGLPYMLAVGALLTVVIVVARFAWIFATTYLPRRVSAGLRARGPAPPWQEAAVLSWAGMRGVVTLAAAFAVPRAVDSGAAFPGRREIIFLAFFVTVATLLLHGLTLPAVIRRLGVEGREEYADRLDEAQAQHTAAQAALERLDELAGDLPAHDSVLDTLRRHARARSNAAWERLGRSEPGGVERPSVVYRRLRREMLSAEREVFVRLRDERRIDEEVMRRVMRELDLEEIALERE
ncbi:Na+/H+ antiporter [Streptomyces sp. TR06-5]|uniref:Na+/H+ antiporter n=1 Tax=unclassified Streptomyces TaxID=2593676 RepID=UPI0039A1DA19